MRVGFSALEGARAAGLLGGELEVVLPCLGRMMGWLWKTLLEAEGAAGVCAAFLELLCVCPTIL